jgi:hypothetical protein
MKYALALLLLTGIVFAGSTRTINVQPFDTHEVMVECSSGNPVVHIVPQARVEGMRNAVDIVCK